MQEKLEEAAFKIAQYVAASKVTMDFNNICKVGMYGYKLAKEEQCQPDIKALFNSILSCQREVIDGAFRKEMVDVVDIKQQFLDYFGIEEEEKF